MEYLPRIVRRGGDVMGEEGREEGREERREEGRAHHTWSSASPAPVIVKSISHGYA